MKNMDIEMINIKKNDFRKIVRIYIDSFSVPPFNEKWNFKTASARIRSYLPYSKVKTIFYERKIVGVVIYYNEIWDKGNYLFVAEIAIKKEFQKKGIGSYIMKKLEEEAIKKGYIAIALWTEKDSVASKMYEKLEYNIIKPAIRMVKELK